MDKFFLEKADINTPKLFEKEVTSAKTVKIVPDESAFFGVRTEDAGELDRIFHPGDRFILDFGDHCVGYLSFRLRHADRYLDAPVRLRLRFGEIPYELSREFSDYHGGLCASWLQEDIINVDFPEIVRLPRRYCFRYLEVTVLYTPRDVMLSDFSVRCVTSADRTRLQPLPAGIDPELAAIDRVAAKTLEDCMQTAYEDGPKRDRRLWTGDLRLQALTDHYLFGNNALARRCLYLFAACEEDGKFLPGCLYQKPAVFYDDMQMPDYALLYCAALCDYYEFTKDAETAKELFPTAVRQTKLACSLIGEDGVIHSVVGWCFIDWAPNIRTCAPLQGVLMYTLEKMAALAEALGENSIADEFINTLELSRKAAYQVLFDKEKSAILSPSDDYQYSVQAQAWMVLGGALIGEEGKAALTCALASGDSVKPVTPYMHHYVVEAMMKLDMKEEALSYIKSYWGSMVKHGADTFWEAYVPGNPDVSPYSDIIMNSYCHAWSCSPSYFIRRYFAEA